MSNPNSAKTRAFKAAFAADAADAAAKAAKLASEGETIGTADKPVNASANLGGAIGHNERAKWSEELAGQLAKATEAFRLNTGKRLEIWLNIGAYLNKFEARFIVHEINPKTGKFVVVKNADGKPKKDNNAYSAALMEVLESKGFVTVENGKTEGLLANKNTRSAAKALATSWEEIENLPAQLRVHVTKHGHPGHAMTAYNAILKQIDKLKKGNIDVVIDMNDFAATYAESGKGASGSTVPHSVDTCKAKIRQWVKDGHELVHYQANTTNEWKAFALILATKVSLLETDVANLTRSLEERDFDGAAPAKGKGKRKGSKTESGDEVSDAEAAFYAPATVEGETPIDAEFTPVEPPAPLALPAPTPTPKGKAKSKGSKRVPTAPSDAEAQI